MCGVVCGGYGGGACTAGVLVAAAVGGVVGVSVHPHFTPILQRDRMGCFPPHIPDRCDSLLFTCYLVLFVWNPPLINKDTVVRIIYN